MNDLSTVSYDDLEAKALIPSTDERVALAVELPQGWVLKKLKPLHRQVAALVAQGMKNVEIARLLSITPQYVTMLIAQPVFREYAMSLCDVANTRMEALFPQVVDELATVLTNGSEKGRLAAARLVLEAQKRIGRPDPLAGQGTAAADRLEKLADRLTELNTRSNPGLIKPGEDIIDV